MTDIVDLIVVDDATDLAEQIARRLELTVTAAHAAGTEPHVVLTGGTIATAAYEQISADAVDWTRVDWWWGDERYVPEGHPERNDRQAREAFLDRVGVPADRVHPMPAHGCSDSMAQAADDYAAQLPDGPFDLVLLGVGPDGHIASLFPGFDQLDERRRTCVEVFGSPKPPPERITLTYPRLNNSREVWLVVSGEGKADAVARALSGQATVHDTPACGVAGLDRTVWLLDEPAASRIRR